MLCSAVFVYTEPRSATHHSRRSFGSFAGLIPIPRSLSPGPRKPLRMNTCKGVSKQRTLTPFRMNTYEKHRGVGVLLLTRFPMRESVLRSIATKDLSWNPMRMRILRERSESKDHSPHTMRESVLRSIATKDLSWRPKKVAIKGSLPAALPFALYDKSVKIRDESHDT
jgi:hypothetical protein